MKIIPILAILFLFVGSSSAIAKQNINVTVLSDLGGAKSSQLKALYLEELGALTQGEFDLNIKDVQIDWQGGSVDQQIDQLYQDHSMDMLLVLGFAANQFMITRKQFPKPTFLPFVVESELVGAPFKESGAANQGVSGKKNLNYLTYSLSFLDAIERLRQVVSFKRIAIISDELVMLSVPDNMELLMEERFGDLTIDMVPTNDASASVVEMIPSEADAVIVGLVPRLSEQQIDQLINDLIENQIPGFSYLGTGLVRRGLLATPTNDSLLSTAARRNALNMQAVMLGEPAADMPVLIKTKPKMTINQSTAEQIGVAIDFKTLIESEVLDIGEGLNARSFDLVSLVRTALENNLQIKDQIFNRDIQENAQRLARGALLPQLSAGASQFYRKDDTGIVLSGAAPEQSTDAVLSLRQSLFSDSEWANYKIQQYLSDASGEQLRQTKLDIVRDAALGMADVLQARSEAAVQQANLSFSERNLELAEDRVSLGASSSADQYRWQTQVANGKSAVFQAFSRVLIAEQNLNRILNRNIGSPINLSDLNLDEVTIFSTDELFELMDNVDSFEWLYNIGLQQAYNLSPEIRRLDALVLAKKREVKTLARQRWMPNLSLSGQVSDNIDQSGLQVNEGTGKDWQVTLNAEVPLFRGGQIKAQRQQGELELAQLENQLELIKQQIAQTLRSSMNNLLTSLFNVEFSANAALAAKQSLNLVTDSYAQGAVSIVDLLDAQTSSLNADLAEIQAAISLFRSGIEMERTIGEYDFLLTEEQKKMERARRDAALESGVYRSINRHDNTGNW